MPITSTEMVLEEKKEGEFKLEGNLHGGTKEMMLDVGRKRRGRKRRRKNAGSTQNPPNTGQNSTNQKINSKFEKHPRTIITNDGTSMSYRRYKRIKHKKRIAGLVRTIRRDTQAAPSNNNEYLMQEHDDLDLEHHNNIENLCNVTTSHNHHSNDQLEIRNEDYASDFSSPEDEEFLTRDFDEAYDVVHTERLTNMSKEDIITEYLLLEERIETLERRLKDANSMKSSFSIVQPNIHLKSTNSNNITPPESDIENSDAVLTNISNPILPYSSIENTGTTSASIAFELNRLREENQKLIEENRYLRSNSTNFNGVNEILRYDEEDIHSYGLNEYEGCDELPVGAEARRMGDGSCSSSGVGGDSEDDSEDSSSSSCSTHSSPQLTSTSAHLIEMNGNADSSSHSTSDN